MIQNSNITDFQQFVRDQAFPCVGAKSALARDQISFLVADDIRTQARDAEITKHLQIFAQKCNADSLFVSFAVIFENTPPLSEIEYEHYLWARLQAIHNLDSVNFAWDKQVSSDPDSPDFSMSVGGKGFYIVGLHPNSSRPARQFRKPALIFNLHSQFELLRSEGSYEKIRATIIERDENLSGTINPMLAQHGQSSEARQYSGRILDDEWKCPFHAKEKVN